MSRLNKFTDQACVVCGHNLGPYLRICDKCGSIQRPMEGDGAVIPPDEFGVCAQCGMTIPIEDALCAECAAIESIVMETTGQEEGGKARIASIVVFLIALAVVVGSIVAMVFAGSFALWITLLCFAAATAVVSAIIRFVILRPTKDRITVYPRYVPKEHED
ncbi:MAG: hypothetical protein KKE79_00455 [Actinobacteria bacterium]|nr:hypothetical protein [Actinomycetota bacterium]MCG2794586.1 hypothetical protein [Actinomycetes bacterium]